MKSNRRRRYRMRNRAMKQLSRCNWVEMHKLMARNSRSNTPQARQWDYVWENIL